MLYGYIFLPCLTNVLLIFVIYIFFLLCWYLRPIDREHMLSDIQFCSLFYIYFLGVLSCCVILFISFGKLRGWVLCSNSLDNL